MADHIKQTKNAINAKRQAIAEEEERRASWTESVSCAPPTKLSH
jgi:survival-of-motor-neuron-related-splicing factor 30